jgi:hypothetical protein
MRVGRCCLAYNIPARTAQKTLFPCCCFQIVAVHVCEAVTQWLSSLLASRFLPWANMPQYVTWSDKIAFLATWRNSALLTLTMKMETACFSERLLYTYKTQETTALRCRCRIPVSGFGGGGNAAVTFSCSTPLQEPVELPSISPLPYLVLYMRCMYWLGPLSYAGCSTTLSVPTIYCQKVDGSGRGQIDLLSQHLLGGDRAKPWKVCRESRFTGRDSNRALP